MTIIELFPWLISIWIMVCIVHICKRFGLSSFLAIIVPIVSGIFAFAAYWFFLRIFFSWLERRELKREQNELKSRNYQTVEFSKGFPSGKNLFYECIICGNIVLSHPKNDTACRCQNVFVGKKATLIEIRDRTKVKLFSRIKQK